MACDHASWEMRDGLAEGSCPICQQAEIEYLRASRDALMGASHNPKDLAEIERLEAQVEALQNKCANRGLSPEDSDALQAENERLRDALEEIVAIDDNYHSSLAIHIALSIAREALDYD